MCLIVFSYKNHPKFDLIFAANRDEAYSRPTRPAQFWNKYPAVLAGKDLEAGGTWMGINKNGHFAALTNYRDPVIVKEDPPSRGSLVLNYLIEQEKPEAYLKAVHSKAVHFMGFNLLAGTVDELYHYSNQEKQINRVEPGVHGLSNHLLDTPWPKVQQAKAELKDIVKEKKINKEKLFGLLLRDDTAPDQDLPDTGIGYELEKIVSPVFIKSDEYGTRSSTVLLIDKRGNVTFEERRFKAGTQQPDEKNRFEFEVELGIRYQGNKGN